MDEVNTAKGATAHIVSEAVEGRFRDALSLSIGPLILYIGCRLNARALDFVRSSCPEIAPAVQVATRPLRRRFGSSGLAISCG